MNHFGPWTVGKETVTTTTTSGTKEASDVAHIDAIYCINLSTRPDRRQHMEEWAQKEKVLLNFLTIDPHPVSGAQGCKESHLFIIKLALEQKLKNVLILEDDVYTMRPLSELPRQFPTKEPWFFCFLGMIHCARFDSQETEWRKVSGWCAHAYVVHHSAFQLILDQAPKFETIDALYASLAQEYQKTFLTNHFFLGQISDKSDIDHRVKWDKNQWEDLDQNKQIVL